MTTQRMDSELAITLERAEELHAQISRGIGQLSMGSAQLREWLCEYDNGGWEAKGYKSIHQAFESELRDAVDFTKRHMYRMLDRGDVAERLQITDGKCMETGLDELHKLDDDEQAAVWKKARMRAGFHRVTPKIIRKVVNTAKKGKAKPAPGPKLGERVTMGERTFNVMRDLDHVIDEVKRLRGPALDLLEEAAAVLRPWMRESNQ